MKARYALALATLPIVCLFAPCIAAAQEEDKSARIYDQDKVVNFIKSNMSGKTLVTQYEGTITGGDLFTEFKRKTIFADISESEKMFTWDILYVITQKNWDLDDEGNKINPDKPGVKDRALTSHTAVGQLDSTGELLGHRLFPINSRGALPGIASVRMFLSPDEESLTVLIDSALYGDCFAPDGGFKPCTTTVKTVYSVADGKLRGETVTRYFDVDPETMERTEKGEPETLIDTEE